MFSYLVTIRLKDKRKRVHILIIETFTKLGMIALKISSDKLAGKWQKLSVWSCKDDANHSETV